MITEEDIWHAEAMTIWESVAPSYVKASGDPSGFVLRGLFRAGATLQQFEEALIYAFQHPGVTKRNAFRFAVGIVRKQLAEATNGAH